MNLTGDINEAFRLRNIAISLRRFHEMPYMRTFDSIHLHMIRTFKLVQYYSDDIKTAYPNINMDKMAFQMLFHDFHEVMPPYDISIREKLMAPPWWNNLLYIVERTQIDHIYTHIINLGDDKTLSHNWMIDMHEKKSIEAKVGKLIDLIDAAQTAYIEIRLKNRQFISPFLHYCLDHIPNYKYSEELKPLFDIMPSKLFKKREYLREGLRIKGELLKKTNLDANLANDSFKPFNIWYDIVRDYIDFRELSPKDFNL